MTSSISGTISESTCLSTFWLILRVVFGLLPQIIEMIDEEKDKQAGRDEVVRAVLKRLKNVSDRAKDARADARRDIDAGVRDDEFQRD